MVSMGTSLTGPVTPTWMHTVDGRTLKAGLAQRMPGLCQQDASPPHLEGDLRGSVTLVEGEVDIDPHGHRKDAPLKGGCDEMWAVSIRLPVCVDVPIP